MVYCYNMTFLVRAEHRAQQEEWIMRRVSHLRNSASFTGTAVRMATVLAVPGMSDYGLEETSLTAQFEFDSREKADAWGDAHFMTIAGAYSRAFGSDAYVMPAIIAQQTVD